MSNMTTILPEPDKAAGNMRSRVLDLLMRHPNMPIPFEVIADALDITRREVETAVRDLEGPHSGEPVAYLHFARCSYQAVFIT